MHRTATAALGTSVTQRGGVWGGCSTEESRMDLRGGRDGEREREREMMDVVGSWGGELSDSERERGESRVVGGWEWEVVGMPAAHCACVYRVATVVVEC